jgi:hypothetical protein
MAAASDRSYMLGDELSVLHRKCTQLHRNFIALSTPRPRQCLQIRVAFPRLEGGRGGNASCRKKLGPAGVPSHSLTAA